MSKSDIFESIRKGLRRGAANPRQLLAVEQRIKSNPVHTIPARARGNNRQLKQKFVQMAVLAAAEVITCDSEQNPTAKIISWLNHHNVEELRTSTSASIAALTWPKNNYLRLLTGAATVSDCASLTDAFAGISETGTLMLYSSAQTPTTLAFLPDYHLVLLFSSQIVGSYEEAWQKLRQTDNGKMPRNVNLITGPSRSADIEQTLLMGAHGPRKLVIFLVDE